MDAELVVPLQARLAAAVAREVGAEASRTAQRLRSLRALPQAFWSIPDRMQSPSGWAGAVQQLSAVTLATLPSDKVARRCCFRSVRHSPSVSSSV